MMVRIVVVLLACAIAGKTQDFQKYFDAAKAPPAASASGVTKSNAKEANEPASDASFSAVLLSKCFDANSRTAGSEIEKQCGLLEAAAFQQALGVYRYQHDLYAWQQTSTIILFWVVVGLVSLGMVFAGVQFARAFRVGEAGTVQRRGHATAVVAPGPPAHVQEVESAADQLNDLAVHLDISAKGVQVSSSVLGVIILVISLAFLYLYLQIVYPIVPAGSAG
jgi:hypothetical protein